MNIVDKEQLLLSFMHWLTTKQMCVAGYQLQALLGTHELLPLHPDDKGKVVKDFLEQYNIK